VVGMVDRSLVFDRSVLYFVTRSGVVDSFTQNCTGCDILSGIYFNVT